MKFLRDNFAYLLLAVVAVVLILVTVSLQVTLFSTSSPSEAQRNQGLLYTLRQQLAELIQPNGASPVTSTTATVGQPVTTGAVLPTNPPNLIVVQPSPLPPTPTTAISQATATRDPATETLLPGAYNVSAVATRLAAPTVTSGQVVAQVVPPPASPTLAPTATSAALPTSAAPPTNTPGVAADFRLGYLTSNPECAAVTTLLQLILEQEFALRVVTIPFAEPAALFAKLADKTEAERVDLSFCYVDPADRSYLQKYFGFVIFIGSGYRQLTNQKFIIMSNAAVKSPIERGNPCLYRFLVNLNLNDVDLAAGDVAGWYQTHAEQVATWTRCE